MAKCCKSCAICLPKRRGQQYCSPCAKQRKLDHLARKRRAAGVPAVGSVINCARCSGPMQKKLGKHRYCDECRDVRRKEVVAASLAKTLTLERRRERERRRNLRPERVEYKRRYSTEYSRRKREQPRTRLNHRISQLMRNSLGSGKGGRKWTAIVGYTITELEAHLERQFVTGMGWHNMGEWHVDHVLPLASFSYETEADPDFRAAWALTNLRPLWATANLRKGATRTHLL
jgi:hypothetical protein